MRRASFRDSVRFWAIEWAVFFLLWLVFVFSLSPSELIAGAFAAALGVLATEVVRHRNLIRIDFRLSWFYSLWRLPFDALRESLLAYRFLFDYLLRRRRSAMNVVALHARTEDSLMRGKRALAVALVSATPNSIALGYDAGQDRLLIHQLYPAPPSPTLHHLGADQS